MLYALQKQKTGNPKIKFSFMTQIMDLNKMGLASLTNVEMQYFDGGSFNPVEWLLKKAADLLLEAAYEGFKAGKCNNIGSGGSAGVPGCGGGFAF